MAIQYAIAAKMLKKNKATNQHTLSLLLKSLLTITVYMVNATNNIGTVTNRKKSVAPRFMKDKITQFKLGIPKLNVKIEK